jgi:hypothetical protein
MNSEHFTSQCDKVLGVLREANGDWVPLPKIAACALQYGARILTLRRRGYRIVNKTEYVNGVRHSWFRLETGPVKPVAAKPLLNIPPRPPETIPMFSGK